MSRFEGKVVLVSGGSSGIGQTTATLFAKEGAKVVITGRRRQQGEASAKVISALGGEATFIQSDISQAAEVESVVEQVVKKYKRLDCFFNNAGISGPVQSLTELDEKTWDDIMNINLKGMWLGMKYTIPAMLKTQPKGGTIVNMSSILGLGGVNIRNVAVPAYMASKHGVIGLTKSAALEFIGQKIRINAVCPGYIQTPMFEEVLNKNPELAQTLKAMHPIGRFGKPEEVAETVLWLCSDQSSFMVGAAVTVDGGFKAK